MFVEFFSIPAGMSKEKTTDPTVLYNHLKEASKRLSARKPELIQELLDSAIKVYADRIGSDAKELAEVLGIPAPVIEDGLPGLLSFLNKEHFQEAMHSPRFLPPDSISYQLPDASSSLAALSLLLRRLLLTQPVVFQGKREHLNLILNLVEALEEVSPDLAELVACTAKLDDQALDLPSSQSDPCQTFIGRDFLSTVSNARAAAEVLAKELVYFEDCVYGLASGRVFVEEGSYISPKDFSWILHQAMDRIGKTFPQERRFKVSRLLSTAKFTQRIDTLFFTGGSHCLVFGTEEVEVSPRYRTVQIHAVKGIGGISRASGPASVCQIFCHEETFQDRDFSQQLSLLGYQHIRLPLDAFKVHLDSVPWWERRSVYVSGKALYPEDI
jgi:hypothetical protein